MLQVDLLSVHCLPPTARHPVTCNLSPVIRHPSLVGHPYHDKSQPHTTAQVTRPRPSMPTSTPVPTAAVSQPPPSPPSPTTCHPPPIAHHPPSPVATTERVVAATAAAAMTTKTTGSGVQVC